ncbi:MAG TPA: hypothetical protein VF099_11410, partial [Ktedonobacterales bacterium]
MSAAVLEPETVNVPLAEVVNALSVAVSPVKSKRPSGAALTFVIGCVTLIMTGFAIIIPVFPQRLQALGLGSET